MEIYVISKYMLWTLALIIVFGVPLGKFLNKKGREDHVQVQKKTEQGGPEEA